jgi:hypothetical protein
MKESSTQRQVKGFWWWPDKSDVRLFGTLTLKPARSPELELVEEQPGASAALANLLRERGSAPDDTRSAGQVIHGVDEQGIPITLLCAGLADWCRTNALLTRTYDAGYALVGIHVSGVDELCIDSLWLQVQHLYGWLGRTGFEREEGPRPGVYSVLYTPPEDKWFSIDPDLAIGIQSAYQAGGNFHERWIREDTALTFRSQKGMSLSRCNELVTAVRRLLHLASLKPVYPVRMTVSQRGHDGQSIEVHNSILREPQSELPMEDRWVFRFEDFAKDFGVFMCKWLDYSKKHQEALGCYSATVYHRLTPELEHLSLMQALEAYHGVCFQSHAMRGLEVKVKELVQLHAPNLAGLVDDAEQFAKVATETRHYYTHHNPDDLEKGLVAKRAGLVKLNQMLKILFQMCVLADLGVPADRFKRLRQQLAKEIIEYL